MGIAVPETRTDYNRLDDVDIANHRVYVPSGFTGTMPNGDTIDAGKTFLSSAPSTRTTRHWPKVQAYLNGGAAPVFTYHRFWAQADIAIAMADYGLLFNE